MHSSLSLSSLPRLSMLHHTNHSPHITTKICSGMNYPLFAPFIPFLLDNCGLSLAPLVFIYA